MDETELTTLRIERTYLLVTIRSMVELLNKAEDPMAMVACNLGDAALTLVEDFRTEVNNGPTP